MQSLKVRIPLKMIRNKNNLGILKVSDALEISIYHQSEFDAIFSTPRLASSSSVTYNFTDNIGLILRYQNI